MKTAKKESEEISSQNIGDAEIIPPQNGNSELAELRRLIVEPEQVSEVLPSAIAEGREKNDALAKSTLPLVEENIRQSVIRNPDVLAEALFPAIGPAIRKAIAEALSQMVQSLNQTLENSISPKGLRWRIEAWQTGKSFAEVVMLNSLIYRVEEVFLIHKETGGLLQHVSAQKNVSEDADMVSAMLTAIQDFAHDSFKDSENAQLDSLQLNDLSVWLERSPDAILAGVIRGNPPLQLREIFEEAVEAIQFVQRDEFENFDGDTTKFEKSRPMLDNCLQIQLNREEKKSNLFSPFNVLAGILGLILLIFGFIYIRDYWRWTNYLDRLKAEKGIVVVESDLGWWKDSISGLRDPSAINPTEILGEYGLQEKWVESDWRDFQDLSPEMILARANKILQPPEGVKLSFENGILTANGNAAAEWLAEAKKLSAAIGGVNEFKFAADALIEKINSQNILFNCGTVDFAEGQVAKLNLVVKDLELLADSGKNWKLEVRGEADATGTSEINAELSRQRAEKVVAELNKSAKLNSVKELIVPIAVGSDANSGCKVDFKVSPQK